MNKTKENLITVAYEKIKYDIITNKSQANQRLSSVSLAKELKMSRTPVREAINLLASEGYVEIINGVGCVVRQLSNQEIQDIFEVRLNLEILSLQKAFHLIPKLVLRDLLNQWYNLKDTIKTSDIINYQLISDLDFKTHLTIIDYCNNIYLNQLLHNIYSQVIRIQFMSAQALSNPLQTIDEHITLIQYIIDENVEASINHLKKHIIDSVVHIENEGN